MTEPLAPIIKLNYLTEWYLTCAGNVRGQVTEADGGGGDEAEVEGLEEGPVLPGGEEESAQGEEEGEGGEGGRDGDQTVLDWPRLQQAPLLLLLLPLTLLRTNYKDKIRIFHEVLANISKSSLVKIHDSQSFPCPNPQKILMTFLRDNFPQILTPFRCKV